jgi:hypothetical protein
MGAGGGITSPQMNSFSYTDPTTGQALPMGYANF